MQYKYTTKVILTLKHSVIYKYTRRLIQQDLKII